MPGREAYTPDTFSRLMPNNDVLKGADEFTEEIKVDVKDCNTLICVLKF